ncbi:MULTISPECIES: type II toxin-antitoxin system HicB family antitoxin [unclassified Moraxella]|uniref:type II toxin-antitoxin system HicB family antitoxin n=1 Tax=unclassified Moraxella TaxID=2685852 RepID=UPI002B4071AD|nr:MULTISPECIES: type II toxin-antitoxin system HicB family antitoxin [unclassified Moraxella]
MLFPIAIEKPANEHECYGVIVPDIAGCFSAGDTPEEAIKNAHEAISLHLESMAEDGDTLPTAKPIFYHQGNSDYDGMLWAVVEVDISAFMGKAEKINVTLPSLLITKIDDKVNAHKSLYKSRSNYLAQLAMADLA